LVNLWDFCQKVWTPLKFEEISNLNWLQIL
jgi:hypothetical protein